MKKNVLTLLVIATFSITSFAQMGVNSDNSAPDASAQLDIKSTDKGLLIPRLTTIQRNAILTPAIGLMVFDTDLQEIFINNSDGWKQGTMSKIPLALTGNGVNVFSVTNTGLYSNTSTAAEFKNFSGYAIKAENSGNPPTLLLKNAGGSALEAKSQGFGSGGYFESETGIGVNIFSKGNHAIYGFNNSSINPTAKFINYGTGPAMELNSNLDIIVNKLIGLKVVNDLLDSYPNTSTAAEFISKGILGFAIKAESAGNPPTMQLKNELGTGIIAKSFGNGTGGIFSSEYGEGASTYANNNSAITGSNGSTSYPTARFSNSVSNGVGLEVNGNVNINGKIINEAYQTPNFENNWTNFGAEWNTAKFYKSKDGRVYLEGVVTGGSSSVIFTLPAGYRPAKRIFFMVSHAGNGRGRVDIQDNGIVSFDFGSSNTQVGLDGISFRVD